jgi:preprotein translocase subunit SecD
MFGSTFGASVVKGFAITLFLGVVISMFTAVVVTRTFLRTAMELAGEKLREHHWLMGV